MRNVGAISDSPLSYPRKRVFSGVVVWIPAFAGMTRAGWSILRAKPTLERATNDRMECTRENAYHGETGDDGD